MAARRMPRGTPRRAERSRADPGWNAEESRRRKPLVSVSDDPAKVPLARRPHRVTHGARIGGRAVMESQDPRARHSGSG